MGNKNLDHKIVNKYSDENRYSHRSYTVKGRIISYLISYHIYLFYLSNLSYLEVKKEGKKEYPAHIYKPLHNFLKQNYTSVNEGINQCIFEIYKKFPESLIDEINSLKRQLLEKEKKLEEFEELK